MSNARLMLLLVLLCSASAPVRAADELLYSTEGNRLRRFDVDTIGNGPLVQDILVERASDGGEGGGGAISPTGRDINGMICPLPDGSGRFIAGEDTRQPEPPAGWGLFNRDGYQIGKLTPTYISAQPGELGVPEPFGCGFDSQGRLFATSVGAQLGAQNGQLIVFFPPFDHFPGPPGAYPNTNATSSNFCKLATDIGTATGLAIDANDNVYVASGSQLQILKFSPPFPTGPDAAGGCGASDPLGSPMADAVNRDLFVQGNIAALNFFTGLAIAPNGNLYAASIIGGRIDEFDLEGNLVRPILVPLGSFPYPTGTPQGLAVDSEGTVYYADLDLEGTFPDVGTGDNGKVRRIRFDENDVPQPPEIVREGLAFPDGLGVFPGNLERREWRTYGGSPYRRFYNPDETIVTPDNVAQLAERWRFPTGAIVTGSPIVAFLEHPEEGWLRVAYLTSWDGNIYAVRVRDGSELWRFAADLQPGATFPNAASAHVEDVNGRETVFLGAGEVMYALDALTGEEIWRFAAGTGCQDEFGDPPGLCGFDDDAEHNEIESSAILADGKVFFGMDVDDTPGGKGGLYALDGGTGHLDMFFDLESGVTCRPLPGDEIARYDGYHSEAELGLPAGFNSRPGCDFDRTGTGCGNVWSSPAHDPDSGLLFIASSNCDTDTDPGTLDPPPPMPPFDEAVFAFDTDGNPVWRWRPREVDNADFAFGAAPNLVTIDFMGQEREALGIGNKDGTYYMLPRDGVNEITGVACDVPDPGTGIVGCDGPALDFPYWFTNVVPGGPLGGIPTTPATDPDLRRVYFGTAPGFDPQAPQQPTIHALDLDIGGVVWDNSYLGQQDANFAPASAIPGVAFFGSIVQPRLRAFESRNDSGTQILTTLISGQLFGAAVASSSAIVDGTLLVGVGIGARSDDENDFGDITSRIPSDLVALCVPGTEGCAPCDDGRDNDGDGQTDGDDVGCWGPGDLSEVPDCEDGLDNDHDGAADYPDDPGCRNRLPTSREDPACDNGRDDDEAGDGIDFPDDPDCGAAWDTSESELPPDPTCGLFGMEALALLGLLGAVERRARRTTHV